MSDNNNINKTKNLKTNRVARKFSNDVWLLLKEIPNGMYPSHHAVSEMIRRCWDNYFETPTSPLLRETLGIDNIKSYSQAQSKYSRGKTGATIEHINEVQYRADELIKMVENNSIITQKEVENYIRDSYLSVYKHYKLEPLEGNEAYVYLPKK